MCAYTRSTCRAGRGASGRHNAAPALQSYPRNLRWSQMTNSVICLRRPCRATFATIMESMICQTRFCAGPTELPVEIAFIMVIGKLYIATGPTELPDATHLCRAFAARPRASRTAQFPACCYLSGFAARRCLGVSALLNIDARKGRSPD